LSAVAPNPENSSGRLVVAASKTTPIQLRPQAALLSDDVAESDKAHAGEHNYQSGPGKLQPNHFVSLRTAHQACRLLSLRLAPASAAVMPREELVREGDRPIRDGLTNLLASRASSQMSLGHSDCTATRVF
jgi:hypothetical protein